MKKKGMIKVTTGYERFVHWILAISCLLLCFTGLGMMFHSLNFFGAIMGGLKGLKVVHNFTGLVFGVSLIMAIKMWWKEAGIFVFPEDLDWIKTAGGYLWHVDKVPETGKYNPGQKMFFLTVALFGLLMLVTGFFMWFPACFPFGIELLRWFYTLHVLGFVVIFAFFFIHLYLGTIGNPGSVQAMITGWMEKPVLKMLHPKWLKEMEHEGKLEVYGGEKKKPDAH
ncbi:MAG: formate dehydrogenase subunit gamma [Deltaproteobacteria bacterium RBG_19FT_COMBO_43_11]|nr:MAG: formate dehydrogenase subunit gamma [Deltaproteobacteria bacterium RBG_16_44_11]OGP87838.1 MAG: formate dehydrogenase subunit gamma [Deltaproteobacteria bacterium RBG_19FT_COMBO_43_11]